jgi:hypothetical protein
VHLLISIEPIKKVYGGRGMDTREPSPWKVEEVLPWLRAARRRFEAEFGQPLHYGFYIRADTQIEEMYGDPAWALKTFRSELEELAASGDTVGLHMHTWRWHEQEKRWYTEAWDEPWLENCFRKGFESFRAALGAPVFAFNPGEYMDNVLFRLLCQEGVKVVIAPVPGERFEGVTDDGSGLGFFFDWRRTPGHPYYPSRHDYQSPGPDPAPLVMIPGMVHRQPWGSYVFHMSPIRAIWRLMRWPGAENIYGYPDNSQPAEGIARLGRLRIFRPKLHRSIYYIAPVAGPFLMRKAVEVALGRCPAWEQVPLAMAVRTDALLAPEAQQIFESDLRVLVREAASRGLEARFVNAGELHGAAVEELAKDYSA